MEGEASMTLPCTTTHMPHPFVSLVAWRPTIQYQDITWRSCCRECSCACCASEKACSSATISWHSSNASCLLANSSSAASNASCCCCSKPSLYCTSSRYANVTVLVSFVQRLDSSAYLPCREQPSKLMVSVHFSRGTCIDTLSNQSTC